MAFDPKTDYDSITNKGMRKQLGMDDKTGRYIFDPKVHDQNKVKSYIQKIKTDANANTAARAKGQSARGKAIKEIFKAGYAQRNSQDPIEQWKNDQELVRQQQEIDKHDKAFNDAMKAVGWDYNDDNVKNALHTTGMATYKDQLGPTASDSGNNLDSPTNKKIFSDAQRERFGGSGGSSAAPAVDTF